MRIIITFLLNAGLNFGVGLVVAAVLGPGGYGRYAVGASAGALLATGFFDWLRLSTTRFYGDAQRRSTPALRATLDRLYLSGTAILVCAAATAMVLPLPFGLTAGFVAAVVTTAVANGVFDFRTALARAEFRDAAYSALVIGKGIGSLALAVGAALVSHDPSVTLAAQALGTLAAVVPVHASLANEGTGVAERRLAGRFAAYGLPIVTANVVFQGILLLNRSLAAERFGFAGAGHLSLATDIELRLLLAVGAAVDVFLFQIAVRRDAAGGRAAGQAQVRDNMVHVAAVLLLLAVGFAGTLPAFTALVVPARFRDGFEPLALAVLPGIVLFCLGQFALNPVFQMAHRTAPIIAGAAASALVDIAGLALVPTSVGLLGIAAVHSVSLGCGFLLLATIALRERSVRPRATDFLGVVGAGGAAALAIWPTRSIPVPAVSLAVAAGAGTVAYVAVLALADVGDVRISLRRLAEWRRVRADAAGVA